MPGLSNPEELGGKDKDKVVIGGGQNDVRRSQSVPDNAEHTTSLLSTDIEAKVHSVWPQVRMALCIFSERIFINDLKTISLKERFKFRTRF